MEREEVLIVAGPHSWVSLWDGPVKSFDEISPELFDRYRTVVLAPSGEDSCQQIFDWKRAGLLNDTRLILGTYHGRHLWSPENDALVDRWVVHGRSERQVLSSEKLVFVPLCVMPPRQPYPPGDDGYLFMGGRKWRELDVGLAAISKSGYPGKVITDRAPPGDFPGVDIRREKVPKKEYSDVLSRARLFLVPLKQTPISHGHVDVVTAILIGKPVLVTAGCSCDDYIQHGVNGLLVRDNSVEAWTDAIHEAYEKADDFAAAARELAPRYRTPKYAEYIWDVIRHPDRNLIGSEFASGGEKPGAARKPIFGDRHTKAAHQQSLREASDLMREKRYPEAMAKLEPCVNGELRLSALRLKMRILVRTDCASSEETTRTLIEEGGDNAEARSNLAAALWAQDRNRDALTEARLAVKMDPTNAMWRRRLVTYLCTAGENDEAARVTEEGVALESNEAAGASAGVSS
jgi:hypothetical protein